MVSFSDIKPYILYHRVTGRCNLQCKICDAWKGGSKNDLDLEIIKKMLYDAKNCGMRNYNIGGGEPLLRKDIGEIIRFAKGLGFYTHLCTNGVYLKEKIDEINDVDYLFVSIDSLKDKHDFIRGKNGVFEAVLDGIKEVKRKKKHINIRIWTVLTKYNYNETDNLVKLAKNLDVGIEFSSMQIVRGYNEDLALNKKNIEEAFKKIKFYKKEGYVIGNTNNNIDILAYTKSFKCDFPKKAIMVKNDGTIYSCEYPLGEGLKNWGNVRELSFNDIFSNVSFKGFVSRVENCNLCGIPCVLRLSPRKHIGYFPFLYPFLDFWENGKSK